MNPRASRGPDLSTWGSVRRWEAATRHRLRQRHALWLHGWCIGAVVLALMWGASHLQMVLGSDSLALRYLVTLGIGYLGFLLVLRWWAGALVGERESGLQVDGGDVVVPGRGRAIDGPAEPVSNVSSGGGGDFGGGGAEASFDSVGLGEGPSIGDAASGAFDLASAADEGAIVVVPVAGVFLIGLLVVFGFGSLMLLYFGWEVLMAVAVEIAFGYVSARTAVRVAREGWLSAAVRLTWKPLLGALAFAVLLGAAVDLFVPKARSLPEAVKILRSR